MMKYTKNRMMRSIVTLCIVMLCFAAAAVTAQAGTDTYTNLIPTDGDSAEALPAKQVTFNEKLWYIIADNSTGATEGTVTLLAADTSFGISAFVDMHDPLPDTYNESSIKKKLDRYTASGGLFSAAADAIVDKLENGENIGKLYLLSVEEFETVPQNVRCLPFVDGDDHEKGWWLRTLKEPDPDLGHTLMAMHVINFDPPYISHSTFDNEYGVRPALQLDLSKVVFDAVSLTFSLKTDVESISLGSSITLDVGSTERLTTAFTPDNATYQTVIWSVGGANANAVKLYYDADCNNEVPTGTPVSVLTVYVKGVSAGTATITATATNGTTDTSDDKTADCSVTAVIPYPLWIDGTQVTSGNQSGTGWSFTPATGDIPATLTLNGFEFTRSDTPLSHENGVKSAISWTGTAPLTISFQNENRIEPWMASGVYSEGDLTITGSGSLEISLTSSYSGIFCQGGLTIEGGTIRIIGGKPSIEARERTIITNGIKSLSVESDEDVAIKGNVRNAVQGTGWKDMSDHDQNKPGELIEPNQSGRSLEDYVAVQFPAPSATVTFTVVNGKWDDGTKEDKTVTLYCPEFGELKLEAGQIPAVGSNPDAGCMEGSWGDPPGTPGTDTVFTEGTTYTYTYKQKDQAVVTKAPSADKLTYSGSPQALVTAGEASGGTMQYALGDADAAPTDGWSDSILPAGTDAGTYYVWYKAKGDDTHTDSDPKYVPVPIVPKSITGAEVTLDQTQLTYNGTVQRVSVTGVTIDGLVLTADVDYDVTGNTGTNAGGYTATVTGQGNFTGTAEAVWSIAPKAMTVSAENVTVPYDGQPHGITVTVTDPSAGAVVTYGKAEGTYDLDESPAITNVSESPLTVYYQVTAENYTDYTGSAVVTITAADDLKSDVKQNELTSVPPELAEFYSDLSELQNALMAKLAVKGEPAIIEQTVFVDVVLEVSFDGGVSWVRATEENFPEGGLWVLLKYPEGTGKDTHDFSVSHMFTVTSDRLGTKAGDVEYPAFEKTDEGLNVKLTGLSPVAIAWREINTPGPEPEPEPERPGIDFFRLHADRELPATGFSSLRPTVLPEQPKDLRYEPVRMHLMLPTLDRDVELVTMPREGNSWAAARLGADAGILEGSALPGEGLSIIAGHNTLNDTDYGPFALLSTLAVNDTVMVREESGALKLFRVYANELLEPDDMERLSALAGDDALVLLTCENESPSGTYLNRRAVFAR